MLGINLLCPILGLLNGDFPLPLKKMVFQKGKTWTNYKAKPSA